MSDIVERLRRAARGDDPYYYIPDNTVAKHVLEAAVEIELLRAGCKRLWAENERIREEVATLRCELTIAKAGAPRTPRLRTRGRYW